MAELMDKQGILDELRRRSGSAQQEQTPPMDKQQILDYLRQKTPGQGTGTFAPVQQTPSAKDFAAGFLRKDMSGGREYLPSDYGTSATVSAGKAGWADYQAQQERYKNQPKQEPKGKSLLDTILEGIAGIGSDTTLPGVGGSQVATMSKEAQANDPTMPRDNWTDDERYAFGYLWNTQRQKAYDYARAVNNAYARQQEEKAAKEAADKASSGFWSGAANTAGAIAAAPLGLADTLKDWIDYGATGHIQEDGQLSPFEWSQAATGGISQKLNEKGGVIDESVPVLGGKGWGDVYGLGTSIAKSLAAAYTGGPGQALITNFGPAVASATDDALSRGATDEQAMGYGFLSGLAEAAAEMVGVDNLLKLSAADSLKAVMKNLLKQGTTEALEEGLTSVVDNLADNLVLRDKSVLNQRIAAYTEQGMTSEQAKKQAWLDMAGDVIFDMLGGFVSGAASGGLETIVQTAPTLGRKPSGTAQQPQSATQSGETAQAEKVPTQAESAAGGRQTAQTVQQTTIDNQQIVQTPSRPMTPQQAMLETIAEIIGVPSVSQAVESYRESGTVTNKQAEAIASNANAVQELLEMAGIAPPSTKSQTRSAVKQAIAKLAQESVDNTPTGDYDMITNQGGATNGESKVSGADATGLPGGTGAAWIRGADDGAISVAGRAPGGMEEGGGLGAQSVAGRPGSRSSEVQLRVPPVLRVSSNLQAARVNSGIQSYDLYDTTSDPHSYEKALTEGRNSDAANGWCVTPKSTQELVDENVRTFMNESRTVGVGVKPDGDIVAVFKNQNGGPKRALDTAMPMAIEMGGDRLDCYGEGLVRTYENYGFIPVARVEFNPKYANEGWTPDKGTPYIYFMAHNGDSADVVTEKIRTYNHATSEELAALPTFGKEAYDDAMAYRDNFIAQRKSQPANAKIASESTGADATIAETVSPAGTQPTTTVTTQDVNTQKYPAPDESVGAAPAGFGGDFYRLQAEYGNLPEGENPVRPDDMPASTTGFDRVSQTAVTVKGAEVTPDSLVGDLEADVVKGGMSYIPIKNSDTTQEAVDYINREGWTQALANWTAAVNSGKSGADLVAQGALLLNNAATAGNRKQWLDILHTYQKLGTNTAQGLQAMRILKTLQPSDKLYMIRRSVEQMVDDLKLKTEIVLDEDLMESYRNAETDAERDEILSQIQKSVANQIPSTFMDKVNALRYLNMLGNPKTQVRNFAGNATMAAVSTIKNEVGAGIELIANKVSGGKVKRTKSFGVSKEQIAAAKNDFDSVKEIVTGERRYDDRNNESDAFRRGVLQNKRVFKNKALEGYRKLTSEVMEKGDLLFSKPAYARALAGYLKANGITETDYSKIDQEFLDEARLYAINEAQEQTFRDTNMLAEAVSSRYRGSNKILKAGDALLNAIIPFRKTPANVLLRAEEYSPLGIANALWNTVQAGRDGSGVTANDAINSWAKTLTGSGLFALGMLLSNLGLLSAGADEDKDKEAFESLSGYQNYAFVARDGTNVTIDFLSPAAIPLLMGAEFWESVNENGLTLDAVWDTAMSMTEPMIQMSMLQSLNDTIEDVRYSDDPSGQIVVNAALNYLMQATTNTLFGQLERGTEDVRMTTYVDKNSPVPDWLQKALGKASAKTPFWDYNQIPYINAWGEEEKNLPTGLNLVYNLLSPGYVESGRKDALTEELNRLGTSTGENVYPDRAPTYITVGGEKKNLSAEEYVAFAKDRGQTQKKLMGQLLASSAYNSLTDAQKAKAVKKVYEYADRSAKKRAEPGYDDGLAKWIKQAANSGNLAEAIINWSKK